MNMYVNFQSGRAPRTLKFRVAVQNQTLLKVVKTDVGESAPRCPR